MKFQHRLSATTMLRAKRVWPDSVLGHPTGGLPKPPVSGGGTNATPRGGSVTPKPGGAVDGGVNGQPRNTVTPIASPNTPNTQGGLHPTKTPGTSTKGSVVGGSDSGSTIYGGRSASGLVMGVSSSSSSPLVRVIDDGATDIDDQAVVVPPPSVMEAIKAWSPKKKLAASAAVLGLAYLLFRKKP